MQTLLSLLPVLLCPLSMVAMIWMMGRHSRTNESAEHMPIAAPPPAGIQSFAGSLWHWLQCCLNWKVGLGLAFVGASIWFVQPGLVGVTVPLLIVLICPLSMLIMLWGRHLGQQDTPTVPSTAAMQGPERRSEGQG
jgi:hypothetical protein